MDPASPVSQDYGGAQAVLPAVSAAVATAEAPVAIAAVVSIVSPSTVLQPAPFQQPPMTILAGAPIPPTIGSHELIIRQQPNRARMCGFGTKDYRPVDPAPILQLIRKEGDQILLDYKQATWLVCHASLWSADGTEDRGVVLNPGSALHARRSEPMFAASDSPTSERDVQVHGLTNLTPPKGYASVLVGSLVSPCHVLTDVDGTKTMFFTFPDLSIRTSGQYMLKFSLYDISRDASHAVASAISDVISVYPPKSFPGMTAESSQLAKCLARQGIRLHIRSDVRRNHSLGGPWEPILNKDDTTAPVDAGSQPRTRIDGSHHARRPSSDQNQDQDQDGQQNDKPATNPIPKPKATAKAKAKPKLRPKKRSLDEDDEDAVVDERGIARATEWSRRDAPRDGAPEDGPGDGNGDGDGKEGRMDVDLDPDLDLDTTEYDDRTDPRSRPSDLGFDPDGGADGDEEGDKGDGEGDGEVEDGHG
ncbi:hypothetical protein HKX48_005738 [Thoreauomyces humboldtii]|nr:hypothetical protein HKX48_005738 [Thoreauomyces humboldtii]